MLDAPMIDDFHMVLGCLDIQRLRDPYFYRNIKRSNTYTICT